MLLAGPTAQWHAFIWQNGVLTDLRTLGGAESFANGINHLGQVAGYSDGAQFSRHAPRQIVIGSGGLSVLVGEWRREALDNNVSLSRNIRYGLWYSV